MADVREHAVHGAGAVVAVVRLASEYMVRWAARASLTRAGLARIGLVLAVLAAVWFTEGGLQGALVGSLLLVAVLFTDSVGAGLEEGGRADALGAWVALLLARLREYVVYAGLALGGALSGVLDAWAWASGALIALALHESVATARMASAVPGAGGGAAPVSHGSPLATMDPSRPEGRRVPSDPTLTAELFGSAPQRSDSAPGPDHLVRIRTTPDSAVDVARWQEGRQRALRAIGVTESGRRGGAYPATGRPRRLRMPRLSARFPQEARFAVIILTITIWDTRVTFVALIVGCVAAIVGELGGPPARHRAR